MISLITGSEGFIGKALTRELLKMGHTVRCLDLVQSTTWADNPKLSRITLNCCDENKLANSAALENVDYIFHLAAVTKETTLEGFRRVNVQPVNTLLKAVKNRRISLKRFVFISTQATARPTGDFFHPQHEDDEPEPVEFYGQSKMEAEQLVRRQKDYIPFTIIRPSSVYGPGDQDFLKLYKLINKGLNVFSGNKFQYISIIHVDDLVTGIIAASVSEETVNHTYFMANRQVTTWSEVHDLIKRFCSRKTVELNLPGPLVSLLAKTGDLAARLTGKPTILNSQKIKLSQAAGWICCTAKARNDFSFSTKYSLWEGIRMTGEWYRTRDLL